MGLARTEGELRRWYINTVYVYLVYNVCIIIFDLAGNFEVFTDCGLCKFIHIASAQIPSQLGTRSKFQTLQDSPFFHADQYANLPKNFKDIYRISNIHISNIGYRQNDSNTRAIVFK